MSKRLKLLKKSAKQRNISVNLNVEFYRKLLDVGCIYCGANLHEQGGYCLDRVDNTKGYTFENVSPCCTNCNRAKGQMDIKEYFDWIKRSFMFQESVCKQLEKDKKSKLELKKISNRMQNRSFYRNSKTIVIEGSR